MAEQTSEPRQRFPRRFYLYRHEDETGISGTGVVADGVVWQNGRVTLVWLGEHPSEVSWQDMSHVVAIHGHNGKTEVVWRDGEEGYPFHDQTECPHEKETITIAGLTLPVLPDWH